MVAAVKAIENGAWEAGTLGKETIMPLGQWKFGVRGGLNIGAGDLSS
jgi:hypothetical protein